MSERSRLTVVGPLLPSVVRRPRHGEPSLSTDSTSRMLDRAGLKVGFGRPGNFAFRQHLPNTYALSHSHTQVDNVVGQSSDVTTTGTVGRPTEHPSPRIVVERRSRTVVSVCWDIRVDCDDTSDPAFRQAATTPLRQMGRGARICHGGSSRASPPAVRKTTPDDAGTHPTAPQSTTESPAVPSQTGVELHTSRRQGVKNTSRAKRQIATTRGTRGRSQC